MYISVIHSCLEDKSSVSVHVVKVQSAPNPAPFGLGMVQSYLILVVS